MRGFSTIEFLIALAIAGSTVIAVTSVAFISSYSISSASLRIGAITHARTVVDTIATSPTNYTETIIIAASSTDGMYSYSTQSIPLESESYALVRASASWESLFNRLQYIDLFSLIRNASSSVEACDPFSSGDWTHPILVHTYQLTSADLLSSLSTHDTYTASAVVATPTSLVLTIGSTTTTYAPTLFVFSGREPATLQLTGSFDNASTSKVGYSTVAAHENTIFAGNAFGSMSPQTCADHISCAQVHVFTIGSNSSLSFTSSLQLSTSSAPFAYTSAGLSATVTSLFYYHDILYMGLRKTVQGDEFNIVDAHDPSHLIWRSGLRIGHSVRSITVSGSYAYISTDDPSRELIIVNIQDVNHPFIAGAWDAPGSTAFGLGVSNTVHDGRVRFGRTYIQGTPEFDLLDVHDPTHILPIGAEDTSTTTDPQSVKALLTQGRITFVLRTRQLEFWDTSDPNKLQLITNPYILPTGSTGVALSCRSGHLFMVRANLDGTSYIDVISSS